MSSIDKLHVCNRAEQVPPNGVVTNNSWIPEICGGPGELHSPAAQSFPHTKVAQSFPHTKAAQSFPHTKLTKSPLVARCTAPPAPPPPAPPDPALEVSAHSGGSCASMSASPSLLYNKTDGAFYVQKGPHAGQILAVFWGASSAVKKSLSSRRSSHSHSAQRVLRRSR